MYVIIYGHKYTKIDIKSIYTTKLLFCLVFFCLCYSVYVYAHNTQNVVKIMKIVWGTSAATNSKCDI